MHCLREEIDSSATLLEWYVNYCCKELDLETEMRMAVIEALVKGRGLLWHEIVLHNGRPMVGAFFDSVDKLFIDPDTVFLRDAGWIARLRIVPAWWVRHTLKLPENVIQALPRAESIDAPPTEIHAGRVRSGPNYTSPESIDTVWFFEVFSRIGVGTYLIEESLPAAARVVFESLGQYLYLLIAPGLDYPLNLSPDFLATASGEEITARLRWPIFLGTEVNDPWPCTILDFYPNTDNPWSTSPLEPGIVFQVFLDALYAYVMQRARHSARVVVAVADDLSDEAVEALLHGRDMEIVRIPRHEIRDMGSAILPINLPEVSTSLWALVQSVERQFERAVGLDPLIYGAALSPQPRSATEVQVREKYLTNRPEDMADRVERWFSKAAQKNAVAARLYIRSPDVAPLFGEGDDPFGPLAQFWDAWVATDDPNEAASEFSYGIEAGSGRRRNREYLASVAQLAMQQLGPAAMEALSKGNPLPMNKLIRFMARTLEADFNEFLITPSEIQEAMAMQQQMMAQQQMMGPPGGPGPGPAGPLVGVRPRNGRPRGTPVPPPG